MGNRRTVGEGISCVARWASAHDDVVCHVTLCLNAASCNAWIHAFVSLAVLIARTVTIENAFRITATIRISKVIVIADAYAKSILLLALSIWTTWRWIARIRFDSNNRR